MAEACSSPDTKAALKAAMINRLVNTDAHFKHQQRGEPDLSTQEKSIIAETILNKSHILFLERFSSFLVLADVEYFKEERQDYSVSYYLQEIEHRCKDTKHNIVKNRRYQALQRLMEEGEYFSEEEMRWRDPLLYEQMIGQYYDEAQKEEEAENDIDRTDLKFSTILLKHMDIQASKQNYERLKEREEEQFEESDESSEDDEEEEMDELREGEDGDGQASEIERNQMRGEFVRIMQERFLSGADKDFDYSKVDSNTDYDSLDILGHDAEEKYFDEDDACSAMEDESEVTKGQDPCNHVTEKLAEVNLDKAQGCPENRIDNKAQSQSEAVITTNQEEGVS